MKISLSEIALWKCLFFGLILGYGLYYAPFGINETDGGFITGLAWQVLNGKVLYQDIIYVRPPLPIWLRALELQCLPEQFEMLGERWVFYLKIGLYSWLGAALLAQGKRRWVLAVFSFVLSAHCYPAMAWHTLDGILLAVLAAYLFFKAANGHMGMLMTSLGGASLVAAILCKQSFYPLLLIFGIAVFLTDRRKAWLFFFGASIAAFLFFYYLYQNELLAAFMKMTNGAASGGQAIQHGILDYFRIKPLLLLPSIGILALAWWMHRKDHLSKWPIYIWAGWLLALMGSYMLVIVWRQAHTVPFAQSRALFWVAAFLIVYLLWQTKGMAGIRKQPIALIAAVLLGITWSAAISWGYSLPLLFSTPWVWAAMELADKMKAPAQKSLKYFRFAILLALLLTFRVAFEYVYRDGRRSSMTEPMGLVFPKLSGIYSSPESVAIYQDLKRLSVKYGPNFTVLPAFPLANYLTSTPPPLPLDWVVNRETNGNNTLIIKNLNSILSIIFIEKEYLEKVKSDAELSLTHRVLESGTVLEETPFFLVIKPEVKL